MQNLIPRIAANERPFGSIYFVLGWVVGNYFFITNSSKYHLKIERELLMLELNNAEVYGLQASLTLLRSDELS